MKLITRVSILFGFLFLIGCAHPITLSPDPASVDRKDIGTKIAKNVGYYISAEDRVKEVTTPGGGGDKVSYSPYRDLEPGLFKVLSNSFKEVHVLKAPDDKSTIASKNIAFVIIPKIETTSSSSSAFTWPPTEFTVSLDCRALSPTGQVVWQTTAKGVGKAEFSEFKSDFSLSGRRASQNALIELQKQIQASPLAK